MELLSIILWVLLWSSVIYHIAKKDNTTCDKKDCENCHFPCREHDK